MQGVSAASCDPQYFPAPDCRDIMVRIELQIDIGYQIAMPGADFIFNIHPAHTTQQTVSNENLNFSQALTPKMCTDKSGHNRLMTLRAMPGKLSVSYAATIDIQHHFADPADIAEVEVNKLPPQALIYLYPSRYCQSDRLGNFAGKEFGALRRGHSRVQSIIDWVRQHVTFTSNSSDSRTSAMDTLIDRVGVCRDFAHLTIALCRALSIPARMATGTDYGADPSLGPPDFHAYVEVYLGDRWYMFDPSGTTIPMAHIRVGTGRDAADVAFATIFGDVVGMAPRVISTAVVQPDIGLVDPHHCSHALSTDNGKSANQVNA